MLGHGGGKARAGLGGGGGVLNQSDHTEEKSEGPLERKCKSDGFVQRYKLEEKKQGGGG